MNHSSPQRLLRRLRTIPGCVPAHVLLGVCLLIALCSESVGAAPRPGLERGADAAQSLTIGVLLLAAVILIGIALLLFVVLWGQRARRIVRQPLPPTSRVDELWFLKPAPRQPVESKTPPPPPGDTPPSEA